MEVKVSFLYITSMCCDLLSHVSFCAFICMMCHMILQKVSKQWQGFNLLFLHDLLCLTSSAVHGIMSVVILALCNFMFYLSICRNPPHGSESNQLFRWWCFPGGMSARHHPRLSVRHQRRAGCSEDRGTSDLDRLSLKKILIYTLTTVNPTPPS